MAPPRQACELYSKAYELAGATVIKSIEILDAIKKIREMRLKVKFGLISLSDILGSESIALVSSLAASITKTAFTSVSRSFSSMMETVISSLLNIFLASPEALISLVTIPQDLATQRCIEERKYLQRARGNLSVITSIISKWVDGLSGERFYNQMKTSLPSITEASKLINQMSDELRGTMNGLAGSDDSFFDESKYSRIQDDLSKAIAITKPQSFINQQLNLTRNIEQQSQQQFKEEQSRINTRYKSREHELVKWYSDQLNDIASKGSGDSLKKALLEEKIRIEYDAKKKILNSSKVSEIEASRVKTSVEAFTSSSAYIKSVSSISDSFKYDIDILKTQLFDFSSNMKRAYVAYQSYHALCNTIYNIKSLLNNLIGEMLDIIKKTSNAGGDKMAEDFDRLFASVDVIKDKFQDQVDRYEKEDRPSASEMSATVSLGNGVLIGVDSLFSATVTKSLIDLINAGEDFGTNVEELDDFILKMENIPDWDGARVTWVSNIVNGATSPYIQLLADTATLLSKTTLVSFSGGKESANIQSILKTVNRTFSNLINHNAIVHDTLSSYTPYRYSGLGDLTQLLNSAGLLEKFATAMSISAVATDVIIDLSKAGFNEFWPNYKNCRKFYPEMFQNPDIVMGVAKKEVSLRSPITNGVYRDNSERNDLYRLQARRAYLSYSFDIKQTDGRNFSSVSSEYGIKP